MKAYVPDYHWHTPQDLTEALKLLASKQAYKPFAGGTDLMVLFEAGKLPAGHYLNLWNIDELKGIEVAIDQVKIGALATYADIMRDRVISSEFSIVRDAASLTGAAAIQNRGTIGGNIANASPAADTPPALLVFNTDIEVISQAGTRVVPYSTFHLDYKKTLLQRGELIKSVRIKRNMTDYQQYYRKIGTRKAQAISKICMAAAFKLAASKTIEDFRLAFGSVAPRPVTAPQTAAILKNNKISKALIDKACQTLATEITPIDDVRSTKDYRMVVAQNLLRELLESI